MRFLRGVALLLCVTVVIAAACGGAEPMSPGTSLSAESPSLPSTTSPTDSPSPMLPSVGPSPTATIPSGTPEAFEDDVPASEVPPDALVPRGTTVIDVWPVSTATGDAIVVAFEDRGADPFVAARGFLIWRRDQGADPPWRPVFGVMSRPGEGVLAIQGSIDDLTGDRSPDALLVERTGGVGNCGRWSAIDLSTGGPVWRRSFCDAEVAAHGDPAGIEVTATVYEPGDPHCCPSSIRTTVYAWRDGRFVEDSVETQDL
jgi:hypothetical protein